MALLVCCAVACVVFALGQEIYQDLAPGVFQADATTVAVAASLVVVSPVFRAFGHAVSSTLGCPPSSLSCGAPHASAVPRTGARPLGRLRPQLCVGALSHVRPLGRCRPLASWALALFELSLYAVLPLRFPVALVVCQHVGCAMPALGRIIDLDLSPGVFLAGVSSLLLAAFGSVGSLCRGALALRCCSGTDGSLPAGRG